MAVDWPRVTSKVAAIRAMLPSAAWESLKLQVWGCGSAMPPSRQLLSMLLSWTVIRAIRTLRSGTKHRAREMLCCVP